MRAGELSCVFSVIKSFGNGVNALLRKLRTVRELGPARRAFLFEALSLPPLIALGFRVAGVPVTQGFLRRWAGWSGRGSHADVAGTIQDGCWAQRFVSRRTGIGGSCLVRSLTLWTMLLRRGVETDLRVGFRRSDGKVEGHAWLEYGGRILNEQEGVAATYTVAERPMRFDVTWR